MNKRAVAYAVGKLLQICGLIMLIPLAIALMYDAPNLSLASFQHPEVTGFLAAIVIAVLAGRLTTMFTHGQRKNMGVREGYAVVTMGWIALSAVGAIPLFVYFCRTCDTGQIVPFVRFYVDAFFETVSGFTTTGSTILTDIESMPRGILFWRSMTHWLGGMGIITLALAIFPAMGVSGYGMYRGEVPGPTKERLMPRLADTAKILWGVYLGFTVLETLLLRLGGMPFFDAFCHTFGTLATGGFSTQNLSIGQYQNRFFHWVICLFMYLSGVNYLIHYRVFLKGDFDIVRKDREFLFYTGTCVVVILFVTGMLFFGGLPETDQTYQHYRHDKMAPADFETHMAAERARVDTLPEAFAESSFQVLSIVTTTGYCTADFDVWPTAVRFLLVVMMFWGGCAGSTGGGIKMIRVLTVLKVAWRELGKLARPRLISPFKIGSEIIPESRVMNILALFNLFMILFMVSSLVMCLFVDDVMTAVTSVAATLFNIGPGLNGVGAIENYAWIPTPAKILLALCMLMGRLEVFSVLIALRPDIWKK